ncbi:hypothetical protein GCM10011332_07680 [Terasakiella brassicae]|uniref:Uncharacterized protein n=1 Tax=Terasakiella brassicae TaxID=1634917 RepID=A0A917BU05_9PROT|nr:hypothetical protein [Terasakiella brassicae]GGF56670.1 hypothetical protein GCM10011332_07680 [Terasakiella brassicae]
MIRIIASVALLFMLNACAGGIAYMAHSELQKAPLRLYDQIPPKKAVVVMSGEQISDLRFAKDKDITRSPNSQFRAWLSEYYGKSYYSATVVDPGTYHLAQIWLGLAVGNGQIQSYPRHEGMDIGTQDYTYMSFDIAPGEVKYIGHLNIKNQMPFMMLKKETDDSVSSQAWFDMVLMPFFTVEVSDKLKEAQQFLAKDAQRPDLKLTTDLARIGTNDHLKRAQMIIDGMGNKITRNDYWKARAIFDREALDRVK